ncbi:hypothetical protein [Streptomyces sp. DSM 118878]
MAATWDKQDQPLREHAQAVARALRTRQEGSPHVPFRGPPARVP